MTGAHVLKINRDQITRLIVVSSLLLLASCSTSFAYNNVGWLSSFWIDDYVDLNKNQSKQLKNIINNTRDWHRQVELPKYKTDLFDLRQLVNQGADTAQLMVKIEQVKQHWRNLLSYASDPLVELAVSLTLSQRQQLLTNIRKDIDEEIEEYASLSEKERQQQRLERQLEYYQRWLVKLSPEQKKLVEQANAMHISSTELWHEYKLKRLAALELLFNHQQLSEAQFKQRLKSIIINTDQFMSGELLRLNAQNLKVYAQLLIALNKTLSVKQLGNVEDEFADLMATVNELITD